MGVKDNFTAEEWKSLLRAPMLAGYAVAGSAPSRREDFVREMAALADGIAEGERRAATDSLLGAVVADIIASAVEPHRLLRHAPARLLRLRQRQRVRLE